MMKHVYANLLQRPTRTIVSTLAIAVGVVLILVSVGLTYGQLADSAERTHRVGGDFMIQPPDASFFFALNSGTLPVKLQRVIEEVPGVEAATPVLAKFISERFHLVFGIDRETFEKVNTSLRFVKGRFFDRSDEVVVDTLYSASNSVNVGDRLDLLGRDFLVCGVFEQGTAARVLMPLQTLQEMNGTPDKATMFFARVEKGEDTDAVYRRLQEKMPHYKITRTADLQDIMAANTPVFRQFLTAIVFLAVVISFLIILLAMYSTITERTREIGILKSLGASKAYIVRLILEESFVICLLGVLAGFVLTFVAIRLILIVFPTMPVMIPGYWRISAAAMAVVGGILGALYPAVKASHLDPVKALGYE
ncbi:MAG TPA: ABC transporter permease [Acidobacteriota bacterium]|jgi:putative ABC transport system permease protein|nr:ABC transporter permease [Acidobacteriota bacterium]HRV07975.1 ABC transporter permease [Acidobacteriota bacterium]